MRSHSVFAVVVAVALGLVLAVWLLGPDLAVTVASRALIASVVYSLIRRVLRSL